MEKSESGRNGLIELLRFIFMMVIVSHHALFLCYQTGTPYDVIWFKGGYTCVEFFFLLSGYFLMKKAMTLQCNSDEKVARLTWTEVFNRVKKIYPAFICGFLLALLIKIQFCGYEAWSSIWSTMGEWTFTIAAGFSFWNDAVVGTIWFFSALIIAIIILFPIMVKHKGYFAMIIAPIVSLLGYGYIVMKYGKLDQISGLEIFIACGLLRGIAGVSFGATIYATTEKMRNRKVDKRVFFIGGIFLICLNLFLMNRYSADFFDFCETFIFWGILVLLFSSEEVYFSLFKNRFNVFLGDLSTIIFVTHTAYVFVPADKWPVDREKEYITYIITVLVTSIIVYIVLRFINKFKMLKEIKN